VLPEEVEKELQGDLPLVLRARSLASSSSFGTCTMSGGARTCAQKLLAGCRVVRSQHAGDVFDVVSKRWNFNPKNLKIGSG